MACKFHLNQSWFRHIQKDSQLLYEYKSSSTVGVCKAGLRTSAALGPFKYAAPTPRKKSCNYF
jgi:hypothetical protein